MKVVNQNVKKLLGKYREISLLSKINTVLEYDTNVSLPPKGSEERAEQTAYVVKLISDKWLDPEFKKLLEKVDRPSVSNALGGKERAILRNLKHAGKYYWKVPQKTIVEFSKVTSRSFMAWQKARSDNKFRDFLPHLKRVIALNKEIAEKLGYKENPYDALLDIYEPGLTAKEFQKIVDVLQPELTKLIKISQKYGKLQGASLQEEFSKRDQEKLTHFVLNRMGYDMDAGRQDVSAHPFTETLGSMDVRITNRYKKDSFIESIMVAMHEGGHALYEQGVNPDYSRTPLEGGVSLGIHESQSRFWENQVGRSREFVEFLTPVLKAYYPSQLSGQTSESLYKMFNQVKPGLIRVEADEVTYNLHVALRFEIENALINEKMKPEDLPEIWNSKMKKYLGVTPETDADGVMQDVHWSYGNFGYFPTYTLGNLYAAQITRVMRKDLEFDDLILTGNLGPMYSWLKKNIYMHGSLYWPDELIKKISGEKLNPKYFLNYLKEKYSKIYGL